MQFTVTFRQLRIEEEKDLVWYGWRLEIHGTKVFIQGSLTKILSALEDYIRDAAMNQTKGG